MEKIAIYTDGCAKNNGTNGIGCVVHFEEANKIALFSRPVAAEGKPGQRALTAEKAAIDLGKSALVDFPATIKLEDTPEIAFFSDCIRVVGIMLKRADKEPGLVIKTDPALPEESITLPFTIAHKKRERDFMPLADELAALGAQNIVINGETVPFEGYGTEPYLPKIRIGQKGLRNNM